MKWISGNQMKLLKSGEEFIQKLIVEIERAQVEIVFETYMFNADSTGKRVAEALIGAARRGVHISLVIDGVGSIHTDEVFLEKLSREGIQTSVFRLFRRWPLLGSLALRRLHRKVIVLDEKRSLVGGINIADEQIDTSDHRGKLDLALLVDGPLVRIIHRHSKEFFLTLTLRWAAWIKFKARPKKSLPVPISGTVDGMYLIRDNFQHRRNLQRFYFRAIESSRQEIYIASAYFVPHLRLRRRLRQAARRGVKITILIQGKSDAMVAYHAARPLFKSLIREGIQIFECADRVLHAKAAVIDNEWATVGSFNWEPFSLFLNIEGNVFAKNKNLAADLKTTFENWRTEYGKKIELADLNMSFLQTLKVYFSQMIYWLTRLIGKYHFD
jgi:cardiolipin synthase